MTVDFLQVQVRAIMGSEPAGSEVEVRCFRDDEQWRMFFAPDDPELARYIDAKASDWNVYLGCAPRRIVYRIATHKRDGGKYAVERVWQLWADIDTHGATSNLAQFRPLPSLIIGSGRAWHYHAYWQLRSPISSETARFALRRLAYSLGADMRSTDAARILRATNTYNHKDGRSLIVDPVMVAPSRAYHLAEIVMGLPDPPERKPTRLVRPAAHVEHDDPLKRIPADVYVPTLCGREPNSRGDVVCPLHDDTNASLHIYADDGGWYCFGCEAGGSIIDFASALWGIDPHGKGYHDIRRRLLATFGMRDAA